MGKPWTVKTWSGWSLSTLLALSIGISALYLVSNPIAMTQHPVIAHHLDARPNAVYMHFIFGPIALILGIFQMLPAIRARTVIHRWIGRAYVLSCLIGAIGGVWLATYSISGVWGQSGFGLLGIFWFSMTLRGYLSARDGDFEDHRRWMIRSYALTFAAVTLRLQLGIVGANGWDMSVLYPIIAWSCWLPNLIAAQWWLVRDQKAAVNH